MSAMRPCRALFLVIISLATGCNGSGGSPRPPTDGGGAPPPAPDAGNVTPPTPDAAPTTDRGSPPAPPPQVGTVEQAGGAVTAVELVGTTVYLTVGPRLTIWDVSDPAAPKLRGQTAPLDVMPAGLAVAGKHAYVPAHNGGENGQLAVFDVADPAAPRLVTTLRTSTFPHGGVAVAGNRLYVTADGQFLIHDLSDPAAPRAMGTGPRVGGARLRVIGNRLYYWGRASIGLGNFVGALDLGAGLTDLGAASIPNALKMDVAPGNLVVATGGGGTQVYDITDPKKPVERFSDRSLQALGVVATAGTAWVPAAGGLYSLDLTAPDRVAKSGPVAMPTELHNVGAAVGPLLVVATDQSRLLTIDVSQPTAPVRRATVDVSLCDYCLSVHTLGDELYLATGTGGLRSGRLPDLGSLGRGHPGGRPDFEDVVAIKGMAYIADWFFGLRGYDTSDPANPRETVTLPLGNPSAIAHEGGRLYLGQTTNGGVLWVFDVANPARPMQLAAMETAQVWDIAVRNGIVYLANGNFGAPGGLRIFDMTTPTAPKMLSHFPCTHGTAVALEGNLAVFACTDRFHFLDVSNPAQPIARATWTPPAPSSPTAVALSGRRAYLGHDGGVAVFDVGDPAAPKMVGQRTTAFGVRGLHVPSPGRVLAACALAGVYQWIEGE
jgi:hypothetical protein